MMYDLSDWVPTRLEAMAAWNRHDWDDLAEQFLIYPYLERFIMCRERAERDYRESLAVAFAEARQAQKEVEG